MERRRCEQCDTVLARDNRGRLCSACRTKRSIDDNAPVPPAALWDRTDIRAAIDARHIGRLFRAYRQARNPTIPQETLARWVQLTQGQVSIIERTRRPVTDLERLERWCDALRMPERLRWFRGPSRPVTEQPEEPDRRNCVLHNPTNRYFVTDRPPSWDSGVVAEHTIAVTQDDLMPPTRRVVLTGAATLAGAALAAELEPVPSSGHRRGGRPGHRRVHATRACCGREAGVVASRMAPHQQRVGSLGCCCPAEPPHTTTPRGPTGHTGDAAGISHRCRVSRYRRDHVLGRRWRHDGAALLRAFRPTGTLRWR